MHLLSLFVSKTGIYKLIVVLVRRTLRDLLVEVEPHRVLLIDDALLQVLESHFHRLQLLALPHLLVHAKLHGILLGELAGR